MMNLLEHRQVPVRLAGRSLVILITQNRPGFPADHLDSPYFSAGRCLRADHLGIPYL
jgi:hypothetical protein